jgi:hypothetical protein
MAIPLSGYGLKAVRTEIQAPSLTGMTAIINASTNASYNTSYKGDKMCLGSYKDYGTWCSMGSSLVTACSLLWDSPHDKMWYADGTNSIYNMTRTGVRSAQFFVPSGVCALAFDGGTKIWTANYTNMSMSSIDTNTNTITLYEKTFLTCCPASLTYDNVHNDFWMANGNGNSLTKVNAATKVETVLQPAGVFCRTWGTTFDGTNIWTFNFLCHSLVKINTTTLGTTTYCNVGCCPIGITYDGTNIWTVNAGENYVSKFNIGSEVTTKYHGTAPDGSVIGYGRGILWDGTQIWYTNGSERSISKISQSGIIRTYSFPWYNVRNLGFDPVCHCVWFPNTGNCMIKMGAY